MLMNDFDLLKMSLKTNTRGTDLPQATNIVITVPRVTQTINHTFNKSLTWYNPPQPLQYVPLPPFLNAVAHRSLLSVYKVSGFACSPVCLLILQPRRLCLFNG